MAVAATTFGIKLAGVNWLEMGKARLESSISNAQR